MPAPPLVLWTCLPGEWAERAIEAGRSVALDATFRRSVDRRQAVALARRHGVEAWLVECVLPEEETRRRLDRRLQRGDSPSDARWELYHQQRRAWDPVTELPLARHVRLDTRGPAQETVRQLVRAVYRRTLRERARP